MTTNSDSELPEGIFSLLDQDLYKFTMQCCVFKYFPDAHVTYNFTNRTPHLKLTRRAHDWLRIQIDKLESIRITPQEIEFFRAKCPYFGEDYLRFLVGFHLKPKEQVKTNFRADEDNSHDEDVGATELQVAGPWVETILYEIVILSLVSEAFFKFCDRDWEYDGQVEKARQKGLRLLEGGCMFAEFGGRRRRDYRTHELVIQGLCCAQDHASSQGWSGKLTGTSNVHLAMRYGLQPIGTVAHEWYMGLASITDDYENANELGLRYWLEIYGKGVLGIALTDTFGTPAFLQAFKKPVPSHTADQNNRGSEIEVDSTSNSQRRPTYAAAFAGVRQDSGDPVEFVHVMRRFYDREGITDKKTIVFSDSLNTELCFQYKAAAEAAGFQTSFGVGTFLTNDFVEKSTGNKSVPMNIVIKLSSASGRPAIKISDNIGKNTGDEATVAEVKQRLGYVEKDWEGGDETDRWGRGGSEEQAGG